MTVQIHHGDCLDVMEFLADAGVQVDSVVTDPPYHLTSIVKRFGSANAAPAKSNGATGVYSRASAGFMGQQWDGGDIAFRPETWGRVFDLLKPGGHLLAFGGTRTFHRMAVAIEDAGFEIRDCIMWLYGSGFPKSHDVSKGIDKAAGAEREVVGARVVSRDFKAGDGEDIAFRSGRPGSTEVAVTVPATDAARQWQGWGTALKPAWEPIVVARKPLAGTVAENVLAHGTGALNIDGCRVPAEKKTGWCGKGAGGNTWDETNNGLGKDGAPRPVDGRWPANVIHDGSDEVLEAFGGKESKSTGGKGVASGLIDNDNIYGKFSGVNKGASAGGFGDSGSVARFFYCAKASKKDRAGSKHPTVKPIALMRYLCRLVTPPGGTVLDPFAGSGSTGQAALEEGFQAILIERESRYVADIKRRIAAVELEGLL